jgi:hypothetical protein
VIPENTCIGWQCMSRTSDIAKEKNCDNISLEIKFHCAKIEETKTCISQFALLIITHIKGI